MISSPDGVDVRSKFLRSRVLWVHVLICFLLSSCALSRTQSSNSGTENVAHPSGDENVVAIEVGRAGLNLPLVQVTICTPNTTHCQTIDKIKLDTATVGLRIYKSAVDLELPKIAAEGGALGVCQTYGGGSNMWGPVKLAEVRMGRILAKDVPIQIVDEGFSESPENCPRGKHSVSTDGANGQLGINLGRMDGLGASYFICTGSACKSVVAETFQRIKNPIAMLPSDSNGFVISLPEVPSAGLSEVRGTLTLGVGTRANNTASSAPQVCKPGEDGFLHSKFAGKSYWTVFDSGTNANNVATTIDLGPHCKAMDDTNSAYLCPMAPQKLAVDLMNRDGSFCKKISEEVVPYDYKSYRTGKRAVGGLTMQWSEATNTSIDFGMPFFYGKSIYFVIDAKDSSLGRGPLIAF